jgi:GDP-L-fucose synthase
MKLRGSTVLVTGGTGFLGTHVVEALCEAGANAVGIGSARYDLRDRQQIDRLLAEVSPDAVVHLAATVGGIGANRAEPGRFFYENALMGIEVIDACRTAKVPKTVVAGTVCAYPKFTPVPFREEELWAGYPEETNAPYGLAKKMLLVQAQAYRKQYGMNVVYVLPVNVYGPGDNFDPSSSHVIPAIIRKLVQACESNAHEVVVWGDGTPTREFLHVTDAARAFRLALEHFDGEEPVNIGSGDEISIRDLTELLADIIGFNGEIVWDTGKPNGQPRRALDTSLAKELFGFEAMIPLSEGLRDLVAWYQAHRTVLG